MNSLLNRAPRFDDIACSLRSTVKQPGAMLRETEEVVAMARKFKEEVMKPLTLEMDRTMQKDPDFLPWEFVKKAGDWGFYTLWIPRIFGGRGYNAPSMSYFLEELGTECLGLANVIGVHYLAVVTVISSWNIRLTNRLFRDVADGERTGRPCLLSLAITEPGAGTDVEEVELVDKGNVACKATKVDGGYSISGSKVFISSGHLSRWHITVSYENLESPSDSMLIAAVKTGSKGFSFGRKEHKMGVKICPASELIFDNCFVPDDLILISRDQTLKLRRSVKQTSCQIIDYVVSASRAGVAAWGTGAARGAFECALSYALETEVAGKPLANQEWAQAMLAEMYKNVAVSRLTYAETNYANGLDGIYRTIQFKPLFYYFKYVPAFIIDTLVNPILNLRATTWLFRKIQMDGQTDQEFHRTSGWGSLAKFAGTDAGVKNCHMALEIMGQDGIRQDRRAEKILRDAKLLQIYEGTNQLNRINLFKCLVAQGHSHIQVFQHE
jgi:alkylation response protein AidB-like acyl-CoA dehydrogenase